MRTIKRNGRFYKACPKCGEPLELRQGNYHKDYVCTNNKCAFKVSQEHANSINREFKSEREIKAWAEEHDPEYRLNQ